MPIASDVRYVDLNLFTVSSRQNEQLDSAASGIDHGYTLYQNYRIRYHCSRGRNRASALECVLDNWRSGCRLLQLLSHQLRELLLFASNLLHVVVKIEMAMGMRRAATYVLEIGCSGYQTKVHCRGAEIRRMGSDGAARGKEPC